MAQNDNVVFKTSTTATIDDLFSWNKSTGQIAAKTDNIPIVPGTVYFTADGHIVHDLAQNNRLWMSKNAYSAIYAEDVAETNTDIANAIKYSIHYVEGPTTDTTAGTWTGTINGITELYDGLTIIYVPAVAGSSTTTLNINGLGAKTCYYNNTSTITTHYSVGTPILLTYRNNCWRRADYNNNTTYSAMSVAEMRAGTATSLRTIRADYLKTFLSTLGGTNLTLTHSNSAPYLQLNHDPSGITAGTYGNSSQQTPSYGGTFNIPYFTVDAQGHITNASTTTVKIPASDNTDYKVRQTPINSNDNNNYRILLSNSANDTEEDSVSKKCINLQYNPSTNKLSTGNLNLTGELNVSGNINMNNSNIYNLNSIYTANKSNTASEGIHFYRDSTHVDSLWINDGDILFVPNRNVDTSTTKSNSQKVARFTENPKNNYLVITDSTTGGIKSTQYLNTHPENAGIIIPFIYNDLAFLKNQGGSYKCYKVNSNDYTSPNLYNLQTAILGDSSSINPTLATYLDKCFDGCPNYRRIDSATNEILIIDIRCPKTYTYISIFYIDFGSQNFRAKNIQLYTRNAASSNDTSTPYTLLSSIDNNTLGNWYASKSFSSTGINEIRFVLTDWTSSSTNSHRISQIGLINYASNGVQQTFMSRGINDPIYRSITPNTTNVYDLGSNNNKWANVYATNFKGNADTATSLSISGTTAQFWRGDNTWSNILAQTAAITLGIDTSNLRIGTTVRTLHIATKYSGTGAGITEGDSAGITFGVSNAAYAGIYYQSSGNYGSRLYFATTNNFASGSYARMMITNDGKVGIGTVTPSQKLEVNGNINVHNIYPIITEVYNLGDSTKKWNYVYANYFNGNGSNLTNLNANNIATGTLSTARGGTGSNSFAANRLIYTSNATTLSSTSNIYSDGSKLAINTTSMIDEADTFEVNGMSYLAGEVITNGTISPVENRIYDLGTEDCRWNKIYVNKFDPDVFLQNINVTLSSTWQNIQNNGVDIELPYDGTYIIQIYDNTTSVGHYQTYWSGIFSWYTGNISGITNSNGYEYSEIPLHGSGQAINTKNIYLRTYSQNSSKMRLQIKGNNNLTSSTSNVISIKIKYIM